jgi:hypothetical protein
MSVADHFDHWRDDGFVREYDVRTARRQFRISVVLIFVLTAAAFALGLLVRLDRPLSPTPVQTKAHQRSFAGASPMDCECYAHLPRVRV